MRKSICQVAIGSFIIALCLPGLPAFASTSLQLIGDVPDVGQARDVVIDATAGIAYVASSQFGFAVVDLANPDKPSVVSTFNPAFSGERVAVDGPLAVAISDTGMTVLGVSNPRLQPPQELGFLAGIFRAAAVAGETAYLLQTIVGNPATLDLIVVDLHNPAAPAVVGRVAVGAASFVDVKVAGPLAFVAAGSAGLRIVDVGNPTAPRIIATAATPGNAAGVDVANGYAYVGASTALVVVDIHNPNAPFVAGSLPIPATRVAAANGKVYALAGSFQVVDVSSPTAPTVTGTANSFGAQALDVLGTDVYLASAESGLYAVNVQNPLAPVVVAHVYNRFDNVGVAVAGQIGVVIAGDGGLKVTDVSHPTAPAVLATMTGSFRGVAMAGSFAYVLQTVPGNPAHVDLVILSVSTPSQPTIAGRVTVSAGSASDVKIAGPLAYVAAGTAGLQIVDISSPTSPRIVGSLTTPAAATAVAVGTGYAYVGTGVSILVVDVHTPTHPALTGSISTAAIALATANQLIYAIDGTHLKIVNAATPSVPVLLSATDSFAAQGFTLVGSWVVLATPALTHSDRNGGLYLFDVSDPRSPYPVDQAIVPGTTRCATTAGGLLYAGDSASIIDVLTISAGTPTSTPVPIATPTVPPTRTLTRAPTSTLIPTWTRTPTGTVVATATPIPTRTLTPVPTQAPTFTLVPTGTPTAGTFQVSGTIRYYSNDAAVDGAAVQVGPPPLQLATSSQIQTNTNGQFAFTASGSWQIMPQKSGDLGASLTVLDAVYALQRAVGLRTLTPDQQRACDADGNGSVSSLDATLIMQRMLGVIPRLPVAQTCNSDWLFLPVPAPASNQQLLQPYVSASSCQPGGIVYQPLASAALNQDFSAVLFGDCTGDWQPPGARASAQRAAGGTLQAVRVGRGRRWNGHLRVPLRVQASGNFQGLDLRLEYDSNRLSIPGVHRVGSARRALLVANKQVPGHLAIGLASAVPLRGGTVLVLDFDGHKSHVDPSAIRIVQATVD
jgi:hypothetical protein